MVGVVGNEKKEVGERNAFVVVYRPSDSVSEPRTCGFTREYSVKFVAHTFYDGALPRAVDSFYRHEHGRVGRADVFFVVVEGERRFIRVRTYQHLLPETEFCGVSVFKF